MRQLITYGILFATLGIPRAAQSSTWVSIGPDGGYVGGLAIDPLDASTIYAGTNGGGVFKSTNGGTTWIAVNSGLTTLSVQSIAQDPAQPNTIFAATFGGSGMFKTTNGGTTWGLVMSGLTTGYLNTVKIAPSAPATVYVGTALNGVFRTTNAGVSWTAASTGLPTAVNALAVDPTDASTVYATTGSGVFKTTDAGGNWAAINTGLTSTSIGSIIVHPTIPSIVYVAAGGVVFKSTNSGASWSAASTGIGTAYASQVTLDANNPDTLYAVSSAGIFKTTSAGTSWSLVNGTFKYLRGLVVDPSGFVYGGSQGGGVFKSTDGGVSWVHSSQGLRASHTGVLAIDPTNEAIMYASRGDGAVLKSTDGGSTWNVVHYIDDNFVYSISVAPSDPNIVYASWTNGGGVFKTTNGGATWISASTGLPATSLKLASHPYDANIVYAATFSGFYKTTNGGSTWTAANNGITNNFLSTLAMSATDPMTLYIGTNGGGAFKTTDAGGTWAAVNNGLTQANIGAIAVDPSDASVAYAVSGGGGGVFKTTNGGASWVTMNTGLPSFANFALAIDPANPATIIVGSYSGLISRSTNGGTSWAPYSIGSPSSNIAVLTFDHAPTPRAYAGTAGTGAFAREPLCGDSILDSGEQCDDGNLAGGDCCDGNCQYEAAGSSCAADGNACTDDACNGNGTCNHPNNSAPCDDGLFCNGADVCTGGACVHGGDPCTGGSECADTCNEAAADCFDLSGTPCTSDGNFCTDDVCNGNGTCSHPNNTAPCNDGVFCNGADVCSGGACTHVGDPCASGPECADACNEATDSCFDSAGAACSSDSNPCTLDQCNGSGSCAHPAGNAGMVCRGAAGPCDIAEQCNGSSTTCPADAFATSGTCRSAAAECDLAESCTGSGAGCPSDVFKSAGTACTSDSDPCTLDECSGSSASCVHGDADADTVGDLCDNCVSTANIDQVNSDCSDPDYLVNVGCAAPPNNKAGCCDGGDVCDACPAQNDNSNCDPNGSAGASIGTGGANVSTPDGSVSMTVPPGALSSDTSITVTENGPGTRFTLDGASVFSYSMRPENLQFQTPVTITFTWDDRDSDGKVDRGTCTGGVDNGLSCDNDADCAANDCTSNTNTIENALILKRNGSRFSKGGFGASPYKCSDHLSGACASAVPNCDGSQAPGTGLATVANCCNPASNTWTFKTCSFSEFFLGLTAGDLVPGRGNPATDCPGEWGIHNPLNTPYSDSAGLPSFKQTCMDGDATCDADGLANGVCTMEVSVCLNVNDPRLVDDTGAQTCTPATISEWILKNPRPDSVNPVEAANALALRDAVSALAASSIGGTHQEVVTFATPFNVDDECTAPAHIQVPLKDFTRKGKSVLKMQSVAGNVRDSDKLKITCLPSDAP